jgi:hypothetical protein
MFQRQRAVSGAAVRVFARNRLRVQELAAGSKKAVLPCPAGAIRPDKRKRPGFPGRSFSTSSTSVHQNW